MDKFDHAAFWWLFYLFEWCAKAHFLSNYKAISINFVAVFCWFSPLFCQLDVFLRYQRVPRSRGISFERDSNVQCTVYCVNGLHIRLVDGNCTMPHNVHGSANAISFISSSNKNYIELQRQGVHNDLLWPAIESFTFLFRALDSHWNVSTLTVLVAWFRWFNWSCGQNSLMHHKPRSHVMCHETVESESKREWPSTRYTKNGTPQMLWHI